MILMGAGEVKRGDMIPDSEDINVRAASRSGDVTPPINRGPVDEAGEGEGGEWEAGDELRLANIT